MAALTDFRNFKIELTEEGLQHITSGHPEITVEDIVAALRDPDEVRASNYNRVGSKCTSELYYRKNSKDSLRFITVVVKLCPDGNFVSTSYTATAMRPGEVIYKKEIANE